MCSLVCFEAKNEEKLNKILLFPLTRSKNCPFWGITKIQKIIKFRIFFMAIVLWSKKKKFANFQTKIFIFKVPVIFWKWKLWRACARPNSQNFWNLIHKNIPNRQHSARYQKSKKSSISLHPMLQPFHRYFSLITV